MKAGRVVPARGLLATALIVSGLCLAQPALADVTVGVAVPRSGPYVAVGEQVLRGVEAAAREANAMGGLDGQPVVLDVQDDVCDSNSATAVPTTSSARTCASWSGMSARTHPSPRPISTPPTASS